MRELAPHKVLHLVVQTLIIYKWDHRYHQQMKSKSLPILPHAWCLFPVPMTEDCRPWQQGSHCSKTLTNELKKKTADDNTTLAWLWEYTFATKFSLLLNCLITTYMHAQPCIPQLHFMWCHISHSLTMRVTNTLSTVFGMAMHHAGHACWH